MMKEDVDVRPFNNSNRDRTSHLLPFSLKMCIVEAYKMRICKYLSVASSTTTPFQNVLEVTNLGTCKQGRTVFPYLPNSNCSDDGNTALRR